MPIRHLVFKALQEDKSRQDITSQSLLGPEDIAEGYIVYKGSRKGVICGLDFAAEAFRLIDRRVSIKVFVQEGGSVSKGRRILYVKGRARGILAAERTALNFLGHLTGIATLTHSFVKTVGRRRPVISDTRKTHPLLRWAEKYAVAVGGGSPHRFDLSEMAMIKDNHLIALRRLYGHIWTERLAAKVRMIQSKGREVEIEAQSLAELEVILKAKPDWVMLDNMPVKQLGRAIKLARKFLPGVKIEVSGGVRLGDLKNLRKLDIDRISSGAIIHSAPFADLSLELTR
ncbi:MAG: carboxylating nicotinate-nucleotide diphosphorylase [Elusimicrobia bacterium]|nr:carboxylating nicotinate-nucleotide diphosphorylase [Elusimicrobiota bacterium]